jgi:hypothetical protein
VPAPEPLRGWRLVARPEALDALERAGLGTALRLATDDLLLIGPGACPAVDDSDAIVVPDTGFVAWTLDAAALRSLVDEHVDWDLPAGRPALAQGLVAAVPAKLWLAEDGSARLVCLAAYAAELQERVLQEWAFEERVG